MYVKLFDNKPSKFPYGLGELKKENPGTSFPTAIPAETLASFDVYEVTPTPAPKFDSTTHSATAWVEHVNGAWLQTWTVQELPEDLAATNVRGIRNQLLSESDWTQIADSPLDPDSKAAWSLYRESLRMIPQQAGFPRDVQWPPEPGSIDES